MILQKLLVEDFGLYFQGFYLLPFLFIGITYEIFYCFYTKDIAREQLKISDIGKVI